MPKKIYLNYEEVKKLWDTGLTSSKIAFQLNVCRDIIHKFLKENNLPPNKCGYKHTDETRKKLSLIKKEFFKNNPDKHPWRSHNKFKSIPCEKLKEWLKSKNISFVEEYNQHNVENRHFSIDIAMPDKMIGIEVNGNQHYKIDGTLKPYYEEREKLLEEKGWKIYQLHFSLCFKIEKLEKMFLEILNSSNKLSFNYTSYVSNRLKPKNHCKKCGTEIYSNHIHCSKCIKLRKKEKIINRCKICSKIITKNAIFCITCSNHTRNISINGNGNTNNLFYQPNLNYCIDCFTQITNGAKRCTSCNAVLHKKADKPTKEKLHYMIWNYPQIEIGKMFKISGNAVKKWCKSYNLEFPNMRGYWNKIKEGYIIDYQI